MTKTKRDFYGLKKKKKWNCKQIPVYQVDIYIYQQLVIYLKFNFTNNVKYDY